MEFEVRFYYSLKDINKIIKRLDNIDLLHRELRTYEKTIQYNHSDSRYDFYSSEIDGRFRIRMSSNEKETKCKLSWKRRLKNTTLSDVNKEEEKEVFIRSEDMDNFIYIVEEVMHFKLVEGYERYRTCYVNDDIEISVDEYPFGLCIEIENKCENKDPEEVVKYWTDKIGLNIADAYRLSWDDKYQELCNEQEVESFNDVTFDKKMPVVNTRLK